LHLKAGHFARIGLKYIYFLFFENLKKILYQFHLLIRIADGLFQSAADVKNVRGDQGRIAHVDAFFFQTTFHIAQNVLPLITHQHRQTVAADVRQVIGGRLTFWCDARSIYAN
jgi:hypothetical protein